MSAPAWDGVERRSGTARATAGLVLAAGAGTRFGPEGKLLAKLDGRPVLEWVGGGAPAGSRELSEVVVVLGLRAQEILERVEFGRAEPVICEEWADGQSASLRLRAGGADGVRPGDRHARRSAAHDPARDLAVPRPAGRRPARSTPAAPDIPSCSAPSEMTAAMSRGR